jgi:hypothetical protein
MSQCHSLLHFQAWLATPRMVLVPYFTARAAWSQAELQLPPSQQYPLLELALRDLCFVYASTFGHCAIFLILSSCQPAWCRRKRVQYLLSVLVFEVAIGETQRAWCHFHERTTCSSSASDCSTMSRFMLAYFPETLLALPSTPIAVVVLTSITCTPTIPSISGHVTLQSRCREHNVRNCSVVLQFHGDSREL